MRCLEKCHIPKRIRLELMAPSTSNTSNTSRHRVSPVRCREFPCTFSLASSSRATALGVGDLETQFFLTSSIVIGGSFLSWLQHSQVDFNGSNHRFQSPTRLRSWSWHCHWRWFCAIVFFRNEVDRHSCHSPLSRANIFEINSWIHFSVAAKHVNPGTEADGLRYAAVGGLGSCNGPLESNPHFGDTESDLFCVSFMMSLNSLFLCL